MSRLTKLAPIFAFLSAASCNDREVVAVEPEPSVVDITGFPLDDNRDIDILFVVDDSNSMLAEQNDFVQRFTRLVDALERDGELPSIHLGVITTDVGGPSGGACAGTRDQAGELRPTGDTCTGPDDGSLFLYDRVDDSGVRSSNYDGELADAFACMAKQGTGGCGFEQPLQAVRLALDNPANQGFFRDHAYLAIIFVTDEDDCSVTEDANLLLDLGDRSPSVLDSPLGPFSSFRCFEFGVTCDGPADPRAVGLRQDCEPTIGSRYLEDVELFIDAVSGSKPSKELILVASIAGDLEPVAVEMRENPGYDFEIPLLAYSCNTALGEAVPPVRLAAFTESFSKSTAASICADDLTGAVDEIVELFDESFDPCLTGLPAEPLECVVVERRDAGTDAETERLIPECDDPADPTRSSELPCYLFTPNPAACADTPTQLEVEVFYADGAVVPPLTRAEVQCVGG